MLRPHEVIRGCSPAHIGETRNCHSRTVRSGQCRGKAGHEGVRRCIPGGILGRGRKHPLPARPAEGVQVRVLHPERVSLSRKAHPTVTVWSTSRTLSAVATCVIEGPASVTSSSQAGPSCLKCSPRMSPTEFLRLAHEVDAFATLNHSKTKRISAADVEQHLRGMGSPVPVTTLFSALEEDGVHTSTAGNLRTP
jgi:hypothetical protein